MTSQKFDQLKQCYDIAGEEITYFLPHLPNLQ